MTAPPQLRVRTPAQVRADVLMLDGRPSLTRAATAAIDGQSAPAPAPGRTVGELWLYGVVGGWWRGFDAESVANALRGTDVDELVVRIHSPGGLASDGVAIGNLLRNFDAEVTVVVDGLAASAASVIAVAGDRVIMCPGSQMMLHDASTWCNGNEEALRKAADWIKGQSDNYAGVYAYRAGGTAAAWRTVMLAETWYTAEQAVTAGLADEVGTRIAAGSPPVAPEDDIDDWDDEMWARAAHDIALLENDVHPAARAAWRGQQLTKPPSASATGSPITQGGSAVAFTTEQLTTMRADLGLPETADEAAIMAAVSAVVAENTEERAAAGIPTGQELITTPKLRDLEARASAGDTAVERISKLEARELDREAEAFLDSVNTKFAATNRAGWKTEYLMNPQGTKEHFASAKDLVPTGSVGHSGAEDDAAAEATAGDLDDVRATPAYKNWSL